MSLVIASAAKQSSDSSWFNGRSGSTKEGSLDCFVASLLARTTFLFLGAIGPTVQDHYFDSLAPSAPSTSSGGGSA